MIRAGDRFESPDGDGGYEAIVDIDPQQVVKSSDFRGYGGLPDPAAGDHIPGWFFKKLTGYTSDAP